MVSAIGFFLSQFASYQKSTLWYILFALGILSSFSAMTYVLFFISLIFLLFVDIKKKNTHFRRIIFTFAIIVFILFFILKLCVPNMLIPTFSRYKEIKSPGSSGYYRIVMPLKVAAYILEERPLGVGLGNIDNFLLDVPRDLKTFLWMGRGYGETLDNILFGWIVMFGVLGFVYLIVLTFLLFYIVKRYSSAIAIAYFFFYVGTGSFVFTDFCIVTTVIMLLITRKKWDNPENNIYEEDTCPTYLYHNKLM